MSEAKAKIIENKIIKMEIKQQLDNCKIAVSDNVDEMTQSNCCIKPKKIELSHFVGFWKEKVCILYLKLKHRIELYEFIYLVSDKMFPYKPFHTINYTCVLQ